MLRGKYDPEALEPKLLWVLIHPYVVAVAFLQLCFLAVKPYTPATALLKGSGMVQPPGQAI